MKRLLAARQIHIAPNPFPQHWKEQNRTDMERNKQAYILSLQDCREFCSVDDEYGNATEFFTWYSPEYRILPGRPWPGSKASRKLFNTCFCITANHRQVDKSSNVVKWPDVRGAYSGEVNSCDEGKYSCFLYLCSTQLLGSRISLGQKSRGSFPSNVLFPPLYHVPGRQSKAETEDLMREFSELLTQR